MWMMDWILWAIIPFVILGSELKMGIFLTVASIVGIVVAFVTNKLKIAHKTKLAAPLIWVVSISNVGILAWFTPIMLYANSVVSSFADSILVPVEYDLSARMTNSLDISKKIGLELNIIQEIAYTFGRVVVALLVTVLVSLSLPLMQVIQVLIVLIIGAKLANYYLSVRYLGIKK